MVLHDPTRKPNPLSMSHNPTVNIPHAVRSSDDQTVHLSGSQLPQMMVEEDEVPKLVNSD